MLEADKSNLANEIWKRVDQDVELPSKQSNPTFVIDGGHLLFKMKWKKGSTFKEIFQSDESYVLKHYGSNSIIVFDGYPQEPSTKDTTHLRRKSTKSGRFVKITPHMKLNMKKYLFLSVLKNKTLFNKMLKDHINNSGSGIQAIQDDADAEYLLAQTTITRSRNSDVVVISADTDVLVLLIHGLEDSSCKIFFNSESVTATRSVPKVWDIRSIQSKLGPNVCNNMLAIHAFFGCDTVSRVYGFGKGTGLKKFIDNDEFSSYLSIFSNKGISQCDIASAGEKAIAMLYGGERF